MNNCFRKQKRLKLHLRSREEGRRKDWLVGWTRKLQRRFVFLALLVTTSLLVWYQFIGDDDNLGLMYSSFEKLTILNDIQLLSQQPQDDQQLLVHFIHTTNQDSFHKRCGRAVESVFFHHPNATVWIHVPDDGHTIALTSDMTNQPIQKLIDAGYDISIQRFQLKPLIEAAIAQDKDNNGDKVQIDKQNVERWMNKHIMPNMMKWNWYVDISDLVRLLVVYTYGGCYLDTDVIVVNPIDNLPNSIGFVEQNHRRLGSGVLKFNNKGNRFLADCINEYFVNYRSNTHVWGYVGPKLLKRIWLSKYPTCQIPDPPAPNIASSQEKSTQLVVPDDPSCPFQVLWQDVYYPNVDNCFVQTPNTRNKQKHIQDNTFIAHIYNQRTKWGLEKLNITKMKKESTLCNWLYDSFCIFCDEDVWDQTEIKVSF